jgi:hypothetical protein
MPNSHKEITLADLGLSSEEMETLVRGSQRFLPAREDDGSLAPVDPDSDVDTEPETPIS